MSGSESDAFKLYLDQKLRKTPKATNELTVFEALSDAFPGDRKLELYNAAGEYLKKNVFWIEDEVRAKVAKFQGATRSATTDDDPDMGGAETFRHAIRRHPMFKEWKSLRIDDGLVIEAFEHEPTKPGAYWFSCFGGVEDNSVFFTDTPSVFQCFGAGLTVYWVKTSKVALHSAAENAIPAGYDSQLTLIDHGCLQEKILTIRDSMEAAPACRIKMAADLCPYAMSRLIANLRGEVTDHPCNNQQCRVGRSGRRLGLAVPSGPNFSSPVYGSLLSAPRRSVSVEQPKEPKRCKKTKLDEPSFFTPADSVDSPDDQCAICSFKLGDEGIFGEEGPSRFARLGKCGHVFHYPCMKEMLAPHPSFVQCPICKSLNGIKTGTQPANGSMTWTVQQFSLAGFQDEDTIEIVYSFRNGIQGPEHPHPGKPYRAYGFPRRAYLPANNQGRKVLRLLKQSFDQRLTFTVGRSVTTGLDDVITWNDIHHKTDPRGGPFGYPDPSYMDTVQAELAQHGIEEK